MATINGWKDYDDDEKRRSSRSILDDDRWCCRRHQQRCHCRKKTAKRRFSKKNKNKDFSFLQLQQFEKRILAFFHQGEITTTSCLSSFSMIPTQYSIDIKASTISRGSAFTMGTTCDRERQIYFPLSRFNSNDLNINDVGQVGILDESFDSEKILIPIVQCNDFNEKLGWP